MQIFRKKFFMKDLLRSRALAQRIFHVKFIFRILTVKVEVVSECEL